MWQVPVVDFSKRAEPDTLRTLREGLKSIGFLILENCEPLFPKSRIERCLTLCECIFAESTAATKAGARTGNDRLRGYFSVGDENVEGLLSHENLPAGRNVSQLIDFKEGWEFGPPRCAVRSTRYPELGRIFGGEDNRYPRELPELEKEIESLYGDLIELARSVCELVEAALGLERGAILNHCKSPCSTLRFLHYWPLPPERQDTVSIGAHRDYGLITLLMVDECGGLEVLAPDGISWIKAPVPSAGFIVNVGDILSQWTNGVCKSNVHRVIHTATARHRYSVPFFFEPDLDTVVEPGGLLGAKTMQAEEAEEGETAGEILVRYYAKSGLLRKELVRSVL